MLSARSIPAPVWLAADQALSSATNIGVMVALAQVTSVRVFGAYTVLFAIHQFSLGLFRTVVGEQRLSGAASGSASGDLTAALAAGVLVGGVVLFVSLLLGELPFEHAAMLGVSIPAVFVQDLFRYRLLAGAKPSVAAYGDLIWLVAAIVVGALLVQADFQTTTAAIAAWCLGGWVSAAFLLVRMSSVLRSASDERAGQSSKSMLAIGGDYVLSRGVTDLSLVVMGLAGAGAAVAGLKGAQLLAAPAVLLITSWRTLALRTFGQGGVTAQTIHTTRRYALIVAGLVVACIAVPLLAQGLASRALGDSWSVARLVLPIWGLVLLARAFMLRGYSAMRSLNRSSLVFRARIYGALIVVPGLAVAVFDNSAVWLAAGLAASAAFQALTFGAALGSTSAGSAAATGDPLEPGRETSWQG